jgi:hypothetical protein
VIFIGYIGHNIPKGVSSKHSHWRVEIRKKINSRVSIEMASGLAFC